MAYFLYSTSIPMSSLVLTSFTHGINTRHLNTNIALNRSFSFRAIKYRKLFYFIFFRLLSDALWQLKFLKYIIFLLLENFCWYVWYYMFDKFCCLQFLFVKVFISTLLKDIFSDLEFWFDGFSGCYHLEDTLLSFSYLRGFWQVFRKSSVDSAPFLLLHPSGCLKTFFLFLWFSAVWIWYT